METLQRHVQSVEVFGEFFQAKEFVETLERTVGADEVLFVCAFAIYQNEAHRVDQSNTALGSASQFATALWFCKV